MDGFGDLEKEFWLGNIWIYHLSEQGNLQIRFDLWDENDIHVYAIYSKFNVKGPEDQFQLSISGYSGNAGDSMAEHNGQKFYTFDKDTTHSRNCSEE